MLPHKHCPKFAICLSAQQYFGETKVLVVQSCTSTALLRDWNDVLQVLDQRGFRDAFGIKILAWEVALHN